MKYTSKNLDRAVNFFQIEKSILANFTSHLFNILSTPITLYLIIDFFSDHETGYFFTFLSITAIVALSELGLSVGITIFASHNLHKIKLDRLNGFSGNTKDISKAISLFKFSFKIFMIIALLGFLIAGITGHVFFTLNDNYMIEWKSAWWIVMISTTLNLLIIPIFSYLEGFNKYYWVALARISAKLFSSITLWLCIMNNYGLFSQGISLLINFFILIFLSFYYWRTALFQIIKSKTDKSFDWFKETFSFQWRVALSHLAGYFLFQLITPIAFSIKGPLLAGKIGISFSIIIAVTTLASSWLHVKGATFGSLVKQKKWAELDKIFYFVSSQSIFISILGSILISLLLYMFDSNVIIRSKFLSLEIIYPLLIAIVINQIIHCQNVYLRSHGKYPLLWIFIFVSLINVVVMYNGFKFADIIDVTLGYLFCMMLNLFLCSIVFFEKKSKWHS